jgi:hypothetical protein
MRGTRIEKEVEIYAKNLTNKTSAWAPMHRKIEKFVKTCSAYR